MKITVNGKKMLVPNSLTLEALIESLALGENKIAVALDQNIVPASAYSSQQIEEGMDIEIVRAVGGG